MFGKTVITSSQVSSLFLRSCRRDVRAGPGNARRRSELGDVAPEMRASHFGDAEEHREAGKGEVTRPQPTMQNTDSIDVPLEGIEGLRIRNRDE